MFFKKKQTVRTYDKENLKPVLRCSICTGEQSAGFQDIRTGRFTEIMLIRSSDDLEHFKSMYGLTEVEKIY